MKNTKNPRESLAIKFNNEWEVCWEINNDGVHKVVRVAVPCIEDGDVCGQQLEEIVRKALELSKIIS